MEDCCEQRRIIPEEGTVIIRSTAHDEDGEQ